MRESITTKQPQPHDKRDWYPYYAGFPNVFAASAIEEHFAQAKSLLDPWNGSGTTTAVAASKGISASGIEINPAVAIIARGRLTPSSIRDSLVPIAEEIAMAARRAVLPDRQAEPLAKWMRGPAVGAMRRLQHAIHDVVTSQDSLELTLAHEPEEGSNALGVLPAFYYTALFATTRDLLSRFRASNPTWLKHPTSQRHRVNPSSERITSLFLERAGYLADRLVLPDELAAGSTRIWTGSVLDLDESNAHDACLTSPPYATRVDYVRSSLAELALLGVGDEQIKRLRERTTGTPLVRGVSAKPIPLISEHAQRVLERVRSHASHGSSSYYGPWIHNYLRDLQGSLERIDRSVKDGGLVGLVVQDSHYKEIHIDLQRIVTETMGSLGRRLRKQSDFSVIHSLARMNPAARKQETNRLPRESFLVFGSSP